MIRFLRRFRHDETGTASIEFVLVFPLLFGFFVSSAELGLVLTRQGMLDRGLDLAVREVRLGNLDPVTHDSLRRIICAGATLIPDCLRQVKLEMLPMDPRGRGRIPGDVDCIDRADPARPLRNFVPGRSNELMVLRACVLFDPIVPTSALGAHLVRASGTAYALVSTAAFVIEPD